MLRRSEGQNTKLWHSIRAACDCLPRHGIVRAALFGGAHELSFHDSLKVISNVLQSFAPKKKEMDMARNDLEKLSLDELRKLRKDVEKAIASFQDRKKAEARKKLEEVARDFGFSLNEITETAPVRKRKPAEPKYANPENPSQTWTGRGRKPGWMVAALKRGLSLDEMKIGR
jgi:DNA-binding protein H-NS